MGDEVTAPDEIGVNDSFSVVKIPADKVDRERAPAVPPVDSDVSTDAAREDAAGGAE